MSDAVRSRTRVELEIPARVAAGTGVPITITLQNTGPESVDLYLRGREITFDLDVERSDGELLWRRLEGEVVQAILRLQVLHAGEVIALRDRWDQRDRNGSPVPPGDYAMTARILTDGTMQLESPKVPFRVDPA